MGSNFSRGGCRERAIKFGGIQAVFYIGEYSDVRYSHMSPKNDSLWKTVSHGYSACVR